MTSKKRRWLTVLLTGLLIISLAAAGYLYSLLRAPAISTPSKQVLTQKADQIHEDRLIVPEVGIDTPIVEGDLDQINHGAWHRYPDRGNPEKGGNFILTGHSFVWAYTPQKIAQQSVFYNLNKLKTGDQLIVHWHGKKYTYKVDSNTQVKPQDIQIENQTQQARMTVYTCTSGGSLDGRVVIVASPSS